MTKHIILNTDDRPFSDIVNASQIANILSRETGAIYKVARHSGGYGLLCQSILSSLPPASESSIDFSAISFRPAWRSQLSLLMCSIIGIVVFVFPEMVLRLVGIHRIDGSIVLQLTSDLGIAITLFSVLRVLYVIYSHDYFIGPKGIEESKGIISKDQRRIEFKHIRGIHLKQSIWARFLSIGTIDIATSGNDVAEVRFQGIANPKRLLGILRDRLKVLV